MATVSRTVGPWCRQLGSDTTPLALNLGHDWRKADLCGDRWSALSEASTLGGLLARIAAPVRGQRLRMSRRAS